MIPLNQPSADIFCQLITRLHTEDHVQLTASGFMPLTIERLDTGIQTPKGNGDYYSFCHYYELNGDLMRDPEICFLMVDNRNTPTDLQNVHIYPQSYQQDNTGHFRECIIIEHNKATKFHRRIQEELCEFAAIWLENIQQQGFLQEAS